MSVKEKAYKDFCTELRGALKSTETELNKYKLAYHLVCKRLANVDKCWASDDDSVECNGDCTTCIEKKYLKDIDL